MKNKKIFFICSGIILCIALILGVKYFNENYQFTFNKNTKSSIEDLNALLLNSMKANNIKHCKELLDKGADPNHEESDGLTLFAKALYLHDKELCDYMIEKGADLSKVKVDANTLYEKQTINMFKQYGIYGVENTLNYKMDEFQKNNGTSKDGNPLINGFEILEHHGGEYITGRIKNTTGRDCPSAYININIFDKNNNLINSTVDSVNNFKNNMIWKFKAPCSTEGEYSYKIMSIDAY